MNITWMSAKFRDSNQLETNVDDILDKFDSKYKLAFYII